MNIAGHGIRGNCMVNKVIWFSWMEIIVIPTVPSFWCTTSLLIHWRKTSIRCRTYFIKWLTCQLIKGFMKFINHVGRWILFATGLTITGNRVLFFIFLVFTYIINTRQINFIKCVKFTVSCCLLSYFSFLFSDWR